MKFAGIQDLSPMEVTIVHSAYDMFVGTADSAMGRLAYEISMDQGLMRPQALLPPDASRAGEALKSEAKRKRTSTLNFLARLVHHSKIHHPHILVRLLANRLVWSRL